ncbi:MAG: aldo/keto reductase [Phycisphaeraceae bacterium]
MTTLDSTSPTFSEHRYDRMLYRRCGRSGLKLPAISLGGWHNFTQRDRAAELMTRSFDLGITHFDFANNYGPPPGIAETHAGDVLSKEFKAHRDELIVSSKAGYRMWPGPYGDAGSRKYLLASLDQSLDRLQLDYVDIFYSHRFDARTPLEETIGALDSAVRQGKALYAGISNYPAHAVVESARIARELGTPLVIEQSPYNMFRRDIEADVIPQTGRMGMGMIVFSPLAQGLLTPKYLGGIPEDSRAASESGFLKKEQITPELRTKLNQLAVIAEERGQSLAQMAINWVLRDERVVSALVGASRVSQIEDNARALEADPLSEDQLERIDAILADVGE